MPGLPAPPAAGRRWQAGQPGRSGRYGIAVEITLTADELRALRLRAQLLSGTRDGDVGAAVSRVVAVQAQAAVPAGLAVRARTRGLLAASVDAAVSARAVVRTWAMRSTLHLVPAADLRWMSRVFGPVFVRAGERRRGQLGLDDATCERALQAIRAVLAGSRPLTRAQLIARIADEGVRIDPRTQAPPHLLAFAAHRGLICRGPDADRDEPTYVLVDEWLPAAQVPDRETAVAELARRYLTGYGPASVADFRVWSGLPAADVKGAWSALDDELIAVDGAGTRLAALGTADLSAAEPAPPRLLGHFDTLLLGYQSRDLILARELAPLIQSGGGMIQPAVVADGRVAGTWRLDRSGSSAVVTVDPAGPLAASVLEQLEGEAREVARFLELTPEFRVRQ
jgi:hypothetical protein